MISQCLGDIVGQEELLLHSAVDTGTSNISSLVPSYAASTPAMPLPTISDTPRSCGTPLYTKAGSPNTRTTHTSLPGSLLFSNNAPSTLPNNAPTTQSNIVASTNSCLQHNNIPTTGGSQATSSAARNVSRVLVHDSAIDKTITTSALNCANNVASSAVVTSRTSLAGAVAAQHHVSPHQPLPIKHKTPAPTCGSDTADDRTQRMLGAVPYSNCSPSSDCHHDSSVVFSQLPSPSMPPTPSDDDMTTMVEFTSSGGQLDPSMTTFEPPLAEMCGQRDVSGHHREPTVLCKMSPSTFPIVDRQKALPHLH